MRCSPLTPPGCCADTVSACFVLSPSLAHQPVSRTKHQKDPQRVKTQINPKTTPGARDKIFGSIVQSAQALLESDAASVKCCAPREFPSGRRASYSINVPDTIQQSVTLPQPGPQRSSAVARLVGQKQAPTTTQRQSSADNSSLRYVALRPSHGGQRGHLMSPPDPQTTANVSLSCFFISPFFVFGSPLNLPFPLFRGTATKHATSRHW